MAGTAATAGAPATETRRRRAALAQRLSERAPDALAALDWDDLERAPEWLALPEPGFTRFQCQVGAVVHARALRLWIDEPRLQAAATALGDRFVTRLLAQPDAATIPLGLVCGPRFESAERVAPQLQTEGAGVLLASLPQGPMRHAASAALRLVDASPMIQKLAETLIARTQAIADGAHAPAAHPAAPGHA